MLLWQGRKEKRTEFKKEVKNMHNATTLCKALLHFGDARQGPVHAYIIVLFLIKGYNYT